MLALSACNKDTSDQTDSTPEFEVEFADCTMDFPELPWSDVKPTESRGGIPAAFDKLDFSELADPIDVSDLLPLYLGFGNCT